MQDFPTDFCFENSEKKVLEADQNSEWLKVGRAYILGQYERYLKNGYEYFIIDFKSYKPFVKRQLILELLKRFPHIGYKAQNSSPSLITEDLAGDPFCKPMMNSAINPEKSPIVKVQEKGINPFNLNAERYVVAMTPSFASTMTDYYL